MKKRIVSMLLALTLVVSGMPVGITAESVYAAEVSESEVLAETEEVEDAQSVVENKDAYETELRPESGDFYAFNVSEDGKAVGSDGVAYEDVTYLSADTVEALGAEGQSAYVEICDQIAEEKNAGDYLKSVVIAVDEDGNMVVQRKVSMKLLQTLMDELTENALEAEAAEDENQVAETTEERSTQEDAKEVDDDDSLAKEGLHNEDSDAENGNDKIDAEETSKVETVVEEDSMEKEELSTEEVMTDGVMTDNAATDDVTTDDVATDEALTEDASVEDEELSAEEVDNTTVDSAAAEDTEDATQEPVLSAENIELIDEPEFEEFEVVGNAKADLIVDLGYGKTGEMKQFNSILPTSDYFYKQLTANQKSIYNASKALGKGTNSFTIAPSSEPKTEDILRAISAYIITEPYKCDWMDLTKDPTLLDTFLVGGGSKKYQKTKITFEKSVYYIPAIQKEANAQVLKLAAEAQDYALEKYPYFPVFGIVEYYDKWICDNNYYNEDGTLDPVPTNKMEAYYYCHSSYGILLKGYGVCESYALAMTRLLDAIGIPNMYATGIGNGSGHAWNYIEMPDGKWYLQDSTWNDTTETKAFLLCGDDEKASYGHKPKGTRFVGEAPFTFVERSSDYYQGAKDGEIILSKHLTHLTPKQKETLICNNAYTDDKNVSKVWLSSDEKVVKVDQKGNVTAVAPGMAAITYTVAGISDTCIVYVSQINSLTFDDGGKANLTTSGSIDDSKGKEQHIYLTVNQKNAVFYAEDLEIKDPTHEGEYADILNAAEIFDPVKIEPSDTTVADVTASIVGDTIDLKITPKKVGKTKIVITFGTKKATLTYSVGEALNEKWFKLEEVDALVNNANLPYTGKAYKPKVVLSDDGKAKGVKFKVSYLNNKDAGTASVIIVGTGAHGGEIRRTFKIQPLPLNVDTGSMKIAVSNLYNGGVNQAKSTVKNLNGTKKVGLKAGKDYDIMYKKEGTTTFTSNPTDVGKYTMKIVGKGNYDGEFPVTVNYEIKPVDLKKVKLKVKVNGTIPTFTVTIGKNVLPKANYDLKFYDDKGCTEDDEVGGTVFMSKTQYFVKVVPKGSNINLVAEKDIKPVSFKTK